MKFKILTWLEIESKDGSQEEATTRAIEGMENLARARGTLSVLADGSEVELIGVKYVETSELERAKKRLTRAAHDFWELAQDGDDLEWLFANLVNHDEGGMEDLMEKVGGEYNPEGE
jgi:hypothetical protein